MVVTWLGVGVGHVGGQARCLGGVAVMVVMVMLVVVVVVVPEDCGCDGFGCGVDNGFGNWWSWLLGGGVSGGGVYEVIFFCSIFKYSDLFRF